MTTQQFAQAIAQVESANRSNPPMGDGGRALGRYQMHPDWVFEWAQRLKIFPTLGEPWDAYFTRLIQAHYSFRVGMGLPDIEIAVSYHLGHICHQGDSDWDQDYADRFIAAAATVTT